MVQSEVDGFLGSLEGRCRIVRRGDDVGSMTTPHDRLLIADAGWCVLRNNRTNAIEDLVLPGDVFWLSPGDDRKLLALTDGRVRIVTREVFDAAVASPGWTTGDLLDALVARLKRFRDVLASILPLSAEERVIRFLVHLDTSLDYRRRGLGGRIPMPIAQREVAMLLGITPSYFNRILADMSQRGELEFDRRTIRVVSPDEWSRRLETRL